MSLPIDQPPPLSTDDVEALAAGDNAGALGVALRSEHDQRRRAECMAHIQTDAVQLALDLLVREPDVAGFFRVFMKRVAEETESHACAVWLMNEDESACDLWMAIVQGRLYTKGTPEWDSIALPRDSMTAHLHAYTPGWTETTEYAGDDPRLPAPVHEFNRANGIDSIVVSPLALPSRNLGWVALSTAAGPYCELVWRRALVDAMARQATLALHHNRVAEQNRLEERRKAVLEERNRIARDIHDTLAQGFAAILMQLQAAQRSAGETLPVAAATSLDTAVELARTHMIEARRSVSALRPQTAGQEDLGAALQRLTDLARRTSGLPVELTVDALPPFGAGVEREIIGIAQEALTNAVRHSRGRRITVRAEGLRSVGFRLAVADDGRGFGSDKCGGGFGMTSMRERAERIGASLTIVTAPRGGTEVVLAWEPPSFSIPESRRGLR
jgi:signal transduction histidine kinase